MRAALTLLVCVVPSLVAAQATPPRRVAVAQFDAPSESGTRQGILAALSEHDDVEVVSLEDIGFTSHRLKADPAVPAGRAKISKELGIDAWIDGSVDGEQAHLALSSATGQPLVALDVRAASAKLLDALAGERMWAMMGPRLSARERGRRALLAAGELARTKIADRDREMERQRALARQRAEQRVARLNAEHELALKKQAALVAELTRQGQLVRDRLALETKEREQADEQRRQAEMQRLAQAAAVQQPPATNQIAYAGRPAQGSYAAPTPYVSNYTAAPPQAAPWTSAPPAYGAAGGVSSSTQRWLQSQQGYAAPAATVQPPVAVPAEVPGYATTGVSPATQRWLAQQQQNH
jgi:hypothetical protein